MYENIRRLWNVLFVYKSIHPILYMLKYKIEMRKDY